LTETPKTKTKVAVLYTKPETVLEDIQRLMELANFEHHLPKKMDTLLKINISWQKWFPGCSTTPWQLEGVIRTLQAAGYDKLIAAQNGTVVVDSREGEVNNRHLVALKRCGLKSVHLGEPGVRWIRYQPKGEMLALDKVYPRGIMIPELMMGKNVVHLPTVKTHVFTTPLER